MKTEHNELDRAIHLLNIAILIGVAIMVATYFIVV